MTLKKIALTFDPSYEGYCRRGETSFMGALCKRVIHVKDTYFFAELRTLGVEVKILDPVIAETTEQAIERFLPELEKAQLVFHQTDRVADGMGDSGWRERYQEGIERFVHDNFLYKGHLVVPNSRSYDNKTNGVRIAREAGIPIPQTRTPAQYLAAGAPLPAVVKGTQGTCGDEIFYFDLPQQVERFFGKKGWEKLGLAPPAEDKYLIQQFILTPSDHFTHYRIFTLGDGTIVGAMLTASADRKTEVQRISEPGPFGTGSNFFTNVDSPLYLGYIGVTSNAAEERSQIPLNPNQNSARITPYEGEILAAHGLDPINPQLPQRLQKLAAKTARAFSRYGCAYGGQDWIQDCNDNFYFLEINRSPGMELFRTVYGSSTKLNDKEKAELGGKMLAKFMLKYNGSVAFPHLMNV